MYLQCRQHGRMNQKITRKKTRERLDLFSDCYSTTEIRILFLYLTLTFSLPLSYIGVLPARGNTSTCCCETLMEGLAQ